MRVVYGERALRDLERIVGAAVDARAARQALALIGEAVEMLARHPHLGRPLRGPLRELVISSGRSGYVAVYRIGRWVEVLAVRHQREAGFR